MVGLGCGRWNRQKCLANPDHETVGEWMKQAWKAIPNEIIRNSWCQHGYNYFGELI